MSRRRRPRTRSLAVIYDEGWAAFAAGKPISADPYAGSGRHGDDIRSGLWRDGWTDGRQEQSDIEALI